MLPSVEGDEANNINNQPLFKEFSHLKSCRGWQVLLFRAPVGSEVVVEGIAEAVVARAGFCELGDLGSGFSVDVEHRS